MKNKIFGESKSGIPLLEEFRKENKKIVFTNGCFDILHAGHVRYLQACKEMGDVLIVGLNTDASVRSIKGANRPIQNEKDRATIIAALGCVDAVIFFSDPTPLSLIETILPGVLVKGGDYEIADIVGREVVERNGGEVTTIPFLEGRSTSAIVNKIRNS